MINWTYIGLLSVLFISLFVILIGSKLHLVLFLLLLRMAKQLTYILSFNTEVLFPSYNIQTLWLVMYRRIEQEGGTPCEPYATVRRRINAEGKYTHSSRPGWSYSIVCRDMLKKSVQYKLSIETPFSRKATELFKND